uniref:Chromo domain-containing protein n=1 Tax=Ananas comosus var. bracteatus TaxID=296719 RepID=A0A6V7QHT3_ANACO|nr:unnamed protein product [Ananas comosus var. bracteatus]
MLHPRLLPLSHLSLSLRRRRLLRQQISENRKLALKSRTSLDPEVAKVSASSGCAASSAPADWERVIGIVATEHKSATHVLEAIPVELREDLSFEEQPVKILAREVKKLRNRKIPYVKILWSNHGEREATWELESPLLERYPHLFQMEY